MVTPMTFTNTRIDTKVERKMPEVGLRRRVPRLVLVVPEAGVTVVDSLEMITCILRATAISVIHAIAWRPHQPIFEACLVFVFAFRGTAIFSKAVAIVAFFVTFHDVITAAIGEYIDLASLERMTAGCLT